MADEQSWEDKVEGMHRSQMWEQFATTADHIATTMGTYYKALVKEGVPEWLAGSLTLGFQMSLTKHMMSGENR